MDKTGWIEMAQDYEDALSEILKVADNEDLSHKEKVAEMSGIAEEALEEDEENGEGEEEMD